jgi:integrase/recombinase XerD
MTIRSFRASALAMARERECNTIGSHDFACHQDLRTTLTYSRTRDRLSKLPAYVIKF